MHDNMIISPDFQFLVEEKGLHVVSRTESPYFDNSEIVIGADEFFVKISRDRGDIYVDLGRSADSASTDLNLLRNLVLGLDSSVDANANEQAVFLRNYYENIRDLFSESNLDATIARVEEFGRDRIKKMFRPRPRCQGNN